MDFIIVFNARDNMSLEALCSKTASSYEATEYTRGKYGNIDFFTYEYDTWLDGEGVEISDAGFSLLKGLAVSDSPPLKYSEQRVIREIVGDYLQVDIDPEGNGSITRPSISFHRLFHFDDGISQIVASDAKLIIRTVNRYRESNLIENFNMRFIIESIDNEWKGRSFSNEFFLDGITRILPMDQVSIKNYSLEISAVKDIEKAPIDHELKEHFETDKEAFYTSTMCKIEISARLIFQHQKIRDVVLNLSGGLDSRLALAVLFHLRSQFDFNLKLVTSGPVDHPDVEIARLLAGKLSLPFENQSHLNTASDIPQSEQDYIDCFRCSLGDWNSNNFRVSRKYISEIDLLGADNFKRNYLYSIGGLNRWFASRIANSDLLPILSLYEINQYALICGQEIGGPDPEVHQDFAYYLIEHFCPQIQDIPYAGQSLRKLNVKPYRTVRESKRMPSHLAVAYFDKALIEKNLGFYLGSTLPFFLSLIHRTLRLFAHTVNRGKVYAFVRWLGVRERNLDTERKRRIAMDFASIAHLRGADL